MIIVASQHIKYVTKISSVADPSSTRVVAKRCAWLTVNYIFTKTSTEKKVLKGTIAKILSVFPGYQQQGKRSV